MGGYSFDSLLTISTARSRSAIRNRSYDNLEPPIAGRWITGYPREPVHYVPHASEIGAPSSVQFRAERSKY
jgi:hypothetical protein